MSPVCPTTTDPEVAAQVLQAGGIVAVPTETVYGLAADAFNPHAVAKIFAAKQRPLFDPLIVHLAEPTWWPRVARELPPHAAALAAAFWPGPLTLVLPKQASIADLVSAGLSTVGVRVPRHPLMTELLRRTDRPLAAPSANLFGRLSPTTAEHVRQQLGSRIDLILDGGPCAVGVESTIVDVLGDTPSVLRPGGLSLAALEAVLGPVTTGQTPGRPSVNETSGPPGLIAPGTLPQHYAPRTPIELVNRPPEVPAGAPWGLLTLANVDVPTGFAVVERLPVDEELATTAAEFFPALHRLDDRGLERIIACRFPERGLGLALNDRLSRAAATFAEPSGSQ